MFEETTDDILPTKTYANIGYATAVIANAK